MGRSPTQPVIFQTHAPSARLARFQSQWSSVLPRPWDYQNGFDISSRSVSFFLFLFYPPVAVSPPSGGFEAASCSLARAKRLLRAAACCPHLAYEAESAICPHAGLRIPLGCVGYVVPWSGVFIVVQRSTTNSHGSLFFFFTKVEQSGVKTREVFVVNLDLNNHDSWQVPGTSHVISWFFLR